MLEQRYEGTKLFLKVDSLNKSIEQEKTSHKPFHTEDLGFPYT